MWKKLLILFIILMGAGIFAAYSAFKYVSASLPDIASLKDYRPLLVSQVYDRSGKKIGEYFREKRILVSFDKIPKDLINAFLAAEDDSFFEHKGVNYQAILRAAIANFRAGQTVQGGSTITQQVAKTLLLTSERTLDRKFREVLLAHKMEENLSKEDILYLYLNQIYFGQGAYGIAAAAETYFRKPVDKISIAEAAILAGLPKAPTAYSPVTNPSRAKERQIYVLSRMAQVGFITKEVADLAGTEPVRIYFRENFQNYAPHFLEAVRLMLISKLSEDQVLNEGLRIHTAIDLPKQIKANEALIKGLKEVDKRQGYRGPLNHFTDPKAVGEFLLKTRDKLILDSQPFRVLEANGHFKDYGPLNLALEISKGLPSYLKIGTSAEAIVSKVDDQNGLVYLRLAETEALIDMDSMTWARKPDPEKRWEFSLIKKPSQALKMGDVIQIKVIANKFTSERLEKPLAKGKKKVEPTGLPDFKKYLQVELDQEPEVEAALISLDKTTGDLLSMVGGANFEKSQYNRALQAARQTGSAFKTIIYAAALDKNYSPVTPIMDAPLVYEEMANNGTAEDKEGQEEDLKIWRPTNHSKKFGGDIIFRNALVQSLNVPTVKIMEDISVKWGVEYAQRLGIFSPLNMDFTLALGSSSVTLYEMTRAFATFSNLGKRVSPLLIHRVENHSGKKILDRVFLDERFDNELEPIQKNFEERRQKYLTEQKENSDTEAAPSKEPPFFFEDADQVINPQTAYIMTQLLKGVIEDPKGTGGKARALGRELAGKTGTTNGYFDAWFIGYSPQISTGVWVGFDKEKTIGIGEVGGRAALPIWIDFMKEAHQDLPQMTFAAPDGIVFANIDTETGFLASAASKRTLRMAFKEGTEPKEFQSQKDEESDFYKRDLTE